MGSYFSMPKGLSAVIHGRVQGVGFRLFVKTRADMVNLSGWVRNRDDGTVEVLAVGKPSDLERFLQEISQGSIGSRVDQVDFQWIENSTPYANFNIRG